MFIASSAVLLLGIRIFIDSVVVVVQAQRRRSHFFLLAQFSPETGALPAELTHGAVDIVVHASLPEYLCVFLTATTNTTIV